MTHSQKILIRRAELIDNDGIIKLLMQIAELHHKNRPDIFKEGSKKYNKDEFEAMLKDETRPVFVAVDENNTVLGYCFCMIIKYTAHSVIKDYNSLYIDDFCVDENCRGQGVGKKLFTEVKEYAKQTNVYNIDLNVWEFNENAMKFYEKCGFKTQRRRLEIIL